MPTLSFIGDIGPLATGVKRGQLKRISSDFSYYGCIAVSLWLTSGEGFRITCSMQTLEEQVEVGVLKIELITKSPAEETSADLPWSFRSGGSLCKLVIEQNGAKVESGIIVQSPDHDEIVIVPAAYPHRLYVQGTTIPPQEVTPEYSLRRYLHEEV